MNYHHFTIEERCCLREYYVKGKSYREIARLLGRNVSSVSRELRRNCTFFRDIPRYYPHTAQKKSSLRSSFRHRGVFWKREVLANVVARTDSEHTVRDEDAVIQDNLPLDRRKILALRPEKPAEERKDAQAFRERRQVHDGEKHTQTG